MTSEADPKRWQAIKRVFEEALALSGEERALYMEGLEGEEREVRAEVQELLAAEGVQSKADGDDPALEGPGKILGHYKLLEEIGSGGFGTVYMAQQTEPVSRRVALKIINPGMDTREVLARFESEQQALALMEHENIARVFDGGVTPAGRPYFVMELVRGIPITEYCDQRRLSTNERLELFRKVCLAIEHAHEKGVVHRDIKPSNVLVTERDGEPVPKVIDFGVAKAIGRELTQRTLFTGFRNLIGTPEYMSPEQTNLSGVQVDRRSDVYSLGVLLYELLTGTRPFNITEILESGYDEMMRVIREQDPPKPSTRLGTLGGELDSKAAQQHTTARALERNVRGELDWITMKCLEKDRARRYLTAKDLADDVACHLEDQPVDAGPPGLAYRARKLVKRNRIALRAGALAILALVVGANIAHRANLKNETALAMVELALEERKAQAGHERDRVAELLSRVLGNVELTDEDRDQAQLLSARWAEKILAGSVEENELEMLARLHSDMWIDGRTISTVKDGANLRVVVSNRRDYWLPGISLAYSVEPTINGTPVAGDDKIHEIYGAYGGGMESSVPVASPTEKGSYVLGANVDVYFLASRPNESPPEYWIHGSDYPYGHVQERLAENRPVLARCRLELPPLRYSLLEAMPNVVRLISDPDLKRVTDELVDLRWVDYAPPRSGEWRERGVWELRMDFDEQVVPLALELVLEDVNGMRLAGGDLIVYRSGKASGVWASGIQRAADDPLGRSYIINLTPAEIPEDPVVLDDVNPVRVTLRASERVALAATPPIGEYLDYEANWSLVASEAEPGTTPSSAHTDSEE